MDSVVIYIDWQYFLGLIGLLILGAWYTNGRFTKLEVSMKWIEDAVKELKLSSDNRRGKESVFDSYSPVSLTPTGSEWLSESGMKKYVDEHAPTLFKTCEEKKETNPYEVQQYIFRVFDELSFDPTTEDSFKKFAYEKGTTMEIIRRIGAIYFRDMCVREFHMNHDDIDKHNPYNTNNEEATISDRT
ncbi:MAG: hypothetical protein A3J54_02650 [Candidatus Ryanbacteria bacterium RIFCSPHIGHO2_02_FULL_45_13b]|uniref:Uncharacterized protein n=1 Tax=Candidatus Ryanbacteria bacterium RIFCSPHIGHO2_02_FULL_45_13b TaxID=1802117 RepID=A0A1G2G8T7_9BACT|nr:MAG: hypothetical protein A3J54_02650 [Candidatus Ryanbacteria bacterium RIFCSPHIGHO2_02_FULL_45_13b]